MKVFSPTIRLTILTAVLFLVGCATLAPSPAIALSVTNVRSVQSTLLETSIELTLRLTNDSAQPLALAGSTHQLYVNDSRVGRGASNERVTVPAFGTSTPTVTVFLDNLTLLRKVKEFSEVPKLAFRLESRLHPVEGALFGDIKVTAAGEIDLAGLGLGLSPASR